MWAPGYALLALAYPRGRLARLERHALAACAGLCLLPLLTLLSSETIGLTGPRVALVAAAATIALGGLSRLRAHAAEEEPVVRTLVPSTRVTIAACAAALLLAGVVEAATHLTARPEPASLALAGAGGAPLVLRPDEGAPLELVATARAGDAAAAGELVVLWDDATLLTQHVALAPHERAEVPFSPPTDARGAHRLRVTWLWLETEATLHVGAR